MATGTRSGLPVAGAAATRPPGPAESMVPVDEVDWDAQLVRARRLGHHLERFRPAAPVAASRVQRVVDAGLAADTAVRWNERVGRIIEERGGGYIVEFVTEAQPPITYRPAQPIPYAELDPVVEAVAMEEGGEEEEFDGALEDLPESVTLGGVAMSWEEGGAGWLLKPDDGSGFPHLTFMHATQLTRFHFTSAQYVPASNEVSVRRKGYAWDGMRRRIVDDPDFAESEQRLPATSVAGGIVTFDLSGGRRGLTVGETAVHAAIPTAAEVAQAFGL